MAKVISRAQKTFTDLYDSYTLGMSSDVIAVPCDQYGKATSEYSATITYSANVGTKSVGSMCSLIGTAPTNVTVNVETSGQIVITVAKNANLADDLKIGFTITTSDSNAFVFERYITFIKVKSGEKIVTFKIYSEYGDTFKEGIDEITMETVAFDGLSQIATATYKWSYYNSDNNRWVDIKNADNELITDSFLTVSKTNNFYNGVFMCTMTYNNVEYKDYFTLKIFNHSYTSVVKFFNGSNILGQSDPFVVAYLELYKDQQEEEMLKSQYYYYHENNVYDASTKSVKSFSSAGIEDQYKTQGTLMYMIYKVINSTGNRCAKYKARLFMYDNGSWVSASDTAYRNKYVYKNDLYDNLYENIATNVIVISKEDVPKYKDINFTVYSKVLDSNGNFVYDNDLIVSRANVTVIDLNDPIISSDEPLNPKDGQLWLNTSSYPYTLYIYENEKWVYFSQQNGKTVYTSEPSSYHKGDLWILGAGEICGSFGEGSMLRAKQDSTSFSASHWEDAMVEFTTLKSNIEQYFDFDKTTGLKIGQSDETFYVNISSTEMGFYDNSDGKHKKVVYIGNESANIDGLTVETNLDVECNATFNQEVDFFGFVWKKESNGSLSLAISS